MKKGSFGETLRRERELRGVALEEIATATRISTRFLEALETERWEHLPGGVFNRGFIRAVARFLGLDEESLIAEYALVTKDKPEVAVWAHGPAAKPRRVLLPALLVLLAVTMAAGAWVAYDELAPLLAAWSTPLPSAPASVLPSPSAISTTTTAPGQTGSTAAPPAAPVPLELKVEAGKPTTLTVSADGKSVFDGHVAAGETRRYQARERFEVAARDSSAVLLELNGHTVEPIGVPGEPGRIVLTRKDLKNPRGGQD